MIALVDADIIVYQSANAADGRTYFVGKHEFKYKKEAVEFCKDFDEPLDSITLDFIPEPVENALRNCKLRLKHIEENVEPDGMMLYLTGSGNYREAIAKTKPYKSSRKNNRIPEHLEACKNYMINIHDAQVIDGAEADDAMGIEQCNSLVDTIICTEDKDLLMIPGHHYNWRTNMFVFTTPLAGLRHFYYQLAMGDTTDDIQGIPGCGKVGAVKLTDDCETEEELFNSVREAYVQYYYDNTSAVSFEGDEDFRAHCELLGDRLMLEMGQLLWIQRNYGELWTFPTFNKETDDVQAENS